MGYKTTTSRPRKLAVSARLYRLSNGPNGHSLNTALVDAKYIPSSMAKTLSVMSPKIGNLVLRLADTFVYSFFDRMFPGRMTDKSSVRRLSAFPDKEGKMRVVGILDYYSQMTLKPLHI